MLTHVPDDKGQTGDQLLWGEGALEYGERSQATERRRPEFDLTEEVFSHKIE